MNIIPKPILNDLRGFKRGRVKFVNKHDGFGFVVNEEGQDLFVHMNWLMYPEKEIKEHNYNIVLYPLDDIFQPDERVLYEEVVGSKGLEAHYVVDELKVQYIRRELVKEFALAFDVWSTLSMYRATLSKISVRPFAVKGQGYVWKDQGVKKIVLFEGNNLQALRSIIHSPTVQIALTQPDTCIDYSVFIDGHWLECECPYE